MKIAHRKIGGKNPPLIVPEIGINHNGSLDKAISITDSAIKSGAEIIKHQTHICNQRNIPTSNILIENVGGAKH